VPGRKDPIATGGFYHVFNRGIAKGTTFLTDSEYRRALATLAYYCYSERQYSLSRLFRFDHKKRREIMDSMTGTSKSIQVISYCLMPNHFHLLLRQNVDDGISNYLSNFQNSYTRFYNTIHRRDGSLFLNQFKAVEIETEEQLTHVSRYIHLNPYTASIVRSLDNLGGYPWSSLNTYLEKTDDDFIENEVVMSLFSSLGSYKEFVFDHADYGRNLKQNEKLWLDFG